MMLCRCVWMWIRNKMFMLNSQFSGIKRLMLLPSIYIATEPSSLYKWSENKVWFDVSSVLCLKRSIFLLFTLQCARRFRFRTFRAVLLVVRASVRLLVKDLLRKSPESWARRRWYSRKFYCLLDQMRFQPLKRNQLIVSLCHIRHNACKNGQILLWFGKLHKKLETVKKKKIHQQFGCYRAYAADSLAYSLGFGRHYQN